MTILVIDDEKELRETLKNALEMEGYDVITAENGLVGLMLAQEKRPDLILLDISMPVMDGFTVLFKLKQNPIMREIPVIILTGQYVDEENLERGFSLGAIEYLYKPIRFTELAARVRSVLRMRSIESEMKKIQMMTERFFINQIKELFSSVKGIIEIMTSSEDIKDELKALLLENYDKMKKWFELIDYFTRLNDISAEIYGIEMKVLDVNSLIRETSEKVKEKFSGVDFEFNLGREALIKGDENWLKIGFKVLFEAMAEAMSFGGKIQIVQVTRSGSEGRFVFITVYDEAKKLASDVAKLLFNPYLVSVSEYKPNYDLLAMNIFHKIIALNGGTVVVEPSEFQSGNKFIIRFHAV